MRKASAVLATLVALTLPFAANAATCKDTKGKFIKCPAVATSTVKPALTAPKTTTSTAKPAMAATSAAKPATLAHKTAAKSTKMATSGKTPRCRNAKGQFAKCGTPGAKPA